MPALIDAVSTYATLGEIMDALPTSSAATSRCRRSSVPTACSVTRPRRRRNAPAPTALGTPRRCRRELAEPAHVTAAAGSVADVPLDARRADRRRPRRGGAEAIAGRLSRRRPAAGDRHAGRVRRVERAAMLGRLAALEVPWVRVGVWQVDERVAPDGDADRNATQLDALGGTHHLMPVTADDLDDASHGTPTACPTASTSCTSAWAPTATPRRGRPATRSSSATSRWRCRSRSRAACG